MRERPILFSGAMVRAILDGRKTQTRRVVKLPHQNPLGAWEPTTFSGTDARGAEQAEQAAIWHTRTGDTLACPYGLPGDRLWVRETWGDCTKGADALAGTHYETPWYRADADNYGLLGHDGLGPVYAEEIKWCPSIYMPRRACRLVLEITGVRVERLQDGEGETAFENRYLAEGVNRIHHGDGDYYYSAFRDEPHPKNWSDPFDAWRELWTAINGQAGWDANPWVWALTFRRVAG